MTTPHVTEIPLRLASVEPDPFIDAPSRSAEVRRRLSAREAREQRVMWARAAGIRNGSPAGRTQRP
jgi:hypothetical protein